MNLLYTHISSCMAIINKEHSKPENKTRLKIQCHFLCTLRSFCHMPCTPLLISQYITWHGLIACTNHQTKKEFNTTEKWPREKEEL